MPTKVTDSAGAEVDYVKGFFDYNYKCGLIIMEGDYRQVVTAFVSRDSTMPVHEFHVVSSFPYTLLSKFLVDEADRWIKRRCQPMEHWHGYTVTDESYVPERHPFDTRDVSAHVLRVYRRDGCLVNLDL